jgi:hypothetical protein
MYGHSLLRLTRRTGEGNRLIDYIVNFAAEEHTKNGLVYAWKGLFGGFAGHFYVMPYYMKIQEYSNIESRDLWEYELALGEMQAERLVAHTWETRSTHFNYYFATENCSYFLLKLLEVADPELRLGRFAQTRAEGRYIYYFLGDRRRAPVISVGKGFNFGRWGQLRLVGDAVGSYREARAELLGYF